MIAIIDDIMKPLRFTMTKEKVSMKTIATKGIKRIVGLILSLVMVSGMSTTAVAAGGWGWGPPTMPQLDMPHGTNEEWIAEDMLSNTPPTNYVVNQNTQGDAKDGKYNAYFLEDELQEVHIEIDENNLNYLLQNAMDEPYVMTTNVTIGDVTLGYCGLRTKGSYTLEHSYTDNHGSDRFSFTVNFGKYIKKKDYGKTQNFFGCNKISFNNFFFDKSMMKEFFALKLLDEMGLPTPQYGLAKLYINGNYYGVYAMVEAMDESILEQYYGVDDKELSSYLCKPEGTKFLYKEISEDPSPLWEYDEDTYADVQDMIPTVTEWVRKLNLLSEGTDFEGNAIDVNSEEYLELLSQVMDTDEVVKYFAVHSWLCQLDNMFVGLKNFGLYVDQTGKSMIVPWDYDLSFGCYYPSTAETTANYDIDVLYKSQFRGDGSTALQQRKNIYAQYPLFNVIYQNEQLMEQYHAYMRECSQIAVLGGTVASTGQSYDPGFFNSYIEKMQEELLAAAGEELADNVYYMNWTNQPRDVEMALPNLAKIIAMRSVGVLAQVDGMDTIVSGMGCELSTLGNASPGPSTVEGILTIVDADTGVFATAEYSTPKLAKEPMLTAKILEETDAEYEEIRAAVGCGEKDNLTVYSMKDRGIPDSAYTLTIPLSQKYMQNEEEILFYSYSEGMLNPLTMTADDNLFTGTTDSLTYIAVVQKAAIPNMILPIAIIAGILVIIAVVFVVLRRKSKKGNTAQ